MKTMSPPNQSVVERYLFPAFFSNNDYELVYNMSVTMCCMSLFTFVMMGFLNAPYGRYSDGRFGFGVSGRLSWLLQESPSFLLPLFLLCYGNCPMLTVSYPNRILLSLFMLHYFQRSFIFSWMLQGSKPVPFIIFLFSFLFCTYNGFLQSYFLTNVALYSATWTKDPRFVGGVTAFFVGLIINWHSDHILRTLRKPGEKGYKIPRGGVFNYVSGANYLGEIIEWWGFAFASWSFPAISFAFFTTLFLGWRACHHHIFYLEKFEDYPKSRKALIPFIL